MSTKMEAVKEFLKTQCLNESSVLEELEFFVQNEVATEPVAEFKQSIINDLKKTCAIKDECVELAAEAIFDYLNNPPEPQVHSVFVYEDTVYLYAVDDWRGVIEWCVDEVCDEKWFVD